MYEPIAIVGCGMRLPGGVDSGPAFWEFLDQRREARSQVPRDRYNVDAFYSPSKYGHVCTKFGNFLQSDLAAFDTSFWANMSAKELGDLDPQERLLLEVVYECLENSGAVDLESRKIGSYIGSFGGDWASMVLRDHTSDGARVIETDDYTLANRLAFMLGLTGPSMVIRTACSSSLICLHEACAALHGGQCESAIVAGSSLILNPLMTMSMSNKNVLSADGRCKSFDESADGFARGEAIVAIHIKPLDAAVRDNDTIRAIIRATSINADGSSGQFLQPNPEAHAELMRSAHCLAGIENEVGRMAMLECHATGTSQGDPKELSAVAKVFGGYGLYVGSVKPNMGHGEGASGLTSVIKMVLALERQLIPPNINYHSPNPKIPFAAAKLTVPIVTSTWPPGKAERVSVNNFGIGGSNAHVVLESARSMGLDHLPNHPSEATEPFYLLPVTATHPDTLQRIVESHKAYLREHSDSLHDLSYTLVSRRNRHQFRTCAVVARASPQTALLTLPPQQAERKHSTVSFVFTGQGAHWAQMGASLLSSNSTFRAAVDRMDNVLRRCAIPPNWSLLEELQKPADITRLGEAEVSMSCCIAVQIGLVDVMRDFGITPSSVVGHSGGEVAAAYACGALTEEAVLVAYFRGLAVSEMSSTGAMAAVGMGSKDVEGFLRGDVIIGCENSPSSVTLSGDGETLDDVLAEIKKAFPSVLTKRLNVSRAFHSGHTKAVEATYKSSIDFLVPKTPQIPFYSSVTGKLLERPLDAAYWAANLTSPVLFSQAVEELLLLASHGPMVLLEIGPHSALKGPTKEVSSKVSAGKSPVSYVPSLVRNEDSDVSLLKCVGLLFQHNTTIDLGALHIDGHVLVDLPPYPWQREGQFWNEDRLSREWRLRQFPRHELLGDRVFDAPGMSVSWRNMLRLGDVLWLQDHKLLGEAVFPGAGYIGMAIEAMRQLQESDHQSQGYTIKQARFLEPLILKEESSKECVTTFHPRLRAHNVPCYWQEFEISSCANGLWTKHATGLIRAGGGDNPPLRITRPERQRHVGRNKWYSALRKAGLAFGPLFQTLVQIKAGIDEPTMTAKVTSHQTQLLDGQESPSYLCHPTVLDAMFQLIYAASTRGYTDQIHDLHVPQFVEEIFVSANSTGTDRDLCFTGLALNRHQGEFIGSATATVSDSPDKLIYVNGMKFVRFSSEDAVDDSPAAHLDGATMVFKPDLSFLHSSSLVREVDGPLVDLGCATRMLVACVLESALEVQNYKASNDILVKYKQWLTMKSDEAHKGEPLFGVPDTKMLLAMTSAERQELIEAEFLASKQSRLEPMFTLFHRAYRGLQEVFQGNEQALSLFHHDDTLERFYDVSDPMDLSELWSLMGHVKPNMRILEIGAGTGGTTHKILQQLSHSQIHRQYSTYTYTDLSSSFFDRARQRFKDHGGITYETLDLSKHPQDQGFRAQSYDLIIGANVVHATPDPATTVSHLHWLLSPAGQVNLIEISPYFAECLSYIMGLLPGWWRNVSGDSDSCVNPSLSANVWQRSFENAGLDKVEIRATRHALAIVAATGMAEGKPTIALTTANTAGNLDDEKARSELVSRGFETELHLDWSAPTTADVTILIDIGESFLSTMDQSGLRSFQDLISNQAKSSTWLLWITRSGLLRCNNPSSSMAVGMARTLRGEIDCNIATLAVDECGEDIWEAVTRLLQDWPRWRTGHDQLNMDFIFADGYIHVGRLYPFSVEAELRGLDAPSACRLMASSNGHVARDLSWCEHEPSALEPGFVRIAPKIVGLNFKDVLIAAGRIRPLSEEDPNGVGFELAGIVMEVGSAVTKLSPGDRCVAVTPGNACASAVTVAVDYCALIPDSLSMEEAATMPLAYSTVIHALCEKGSMKKGQSVLIHSAAGAVGLAAIQLCLHLGSTIYCTVGDERKADMISTQYNVPRNHIFNSRNTNFKREVFHLTDGRGVDVVLNSLTGELLHASWECVAPEGCLVELGKRDHLGGGTLDMTPFLQNRTYFGVDIAALFWAHPNRCSQLLAQMLHLHHDGCIHPIQPRTLYGMGEVHDAIKFMEQGHHVGKVLVEMPEGVNAPELRPSRRHFALHPQRSYVMSGGLGGVGQVIALWLARSGAAEIVFLSPSAGDSERYAEFTDTLAALDCKAVLVKGSVAIRQDVIDAFGHATHPIAGIVHLAMVLRDGRFLSMPIADWQDATDPKIKGVVNLHDISVEHCLSLDFFIVTSSISHLMSTPGQASYAAATTFMDGFIQKRRQQGLPAACIALGVISEVGHVSRDLPIQKSLLSRLAGSVSTRQLLDAMQLAVERSAIPSTHIAQTDGVRSNGENGFHSVNIIHEIPGMIYVGATPSTENVSPFLFGLPRSEQVHNPQNQSTDNDTLEQFFNNLEKNPGIFDEAQAGPFLANQIQSYVCRLVGQDEALVKTDDTLESIGMDSLTSVELRAWFASKMRIKMTPIDITSARTIGGLGKLASSHLARIFRDK